MYCIHKRYRERLYPHLRPEQRVVLLPFAAYCEIGCNPNTTIDLSAADQHTLAKAQNHYAWAKNDSRVVGLFIYRLKNLWQGTTMKGLDTCHNPWGTGLGLVDTCASGSYATPKTVAFYHQKGASASTAIATLDAAAPAGAAVADRTCGSDVFVSSIDGDDSADGCTNKTPVATLARAQQLSRTRIAELASNDPSSPSSDAVTVRMSGAFHLSTSIAFTSEDKGVRWTSLGYNSSAATKTHVTGGTSTTGSTDTDAAAAAATIYGGIALPHPSQWSPVTDASTLDRVANLEARSRLRQLSLGASPGGLNLSNAEIGRLTRHGFTIGAQAPPLELFYNSSRLQRSRWPKVGDPPSSIVHIQNSNHTSPVFSVNSTRPLAWPASMASDSGGVWLDGLLGQNWVWTYNRATSLGNGSLTLVYPEVEDLKLFSPT